MRYTAIATDAGREVQIQAFKTAEPSIINSVKKIMNCEPKLIKATTTSRGTSVIYQLRTTPNDGALEELITLIEQVTIGKGYNYQFGLDAEDAQLTVLIKAH